MLAVGYCKPLFTGKIMTCFMRPCMAVLSKHSLKNYDEKGSYKYFF